MAEVKNYGPKNGKPGLPVNIMGSGFSALTNVRVKFGQTLVAGPITEVKNDQHIKTEVPAVSGAMAMVVFADELPDGMLVGSFRVGTEPADLVISDEFPDLLPSGGGNLSLFGFHFNDNGRTAKTVTLIALDQDTFEPVRVEAVNVQTVNGTLITMTAPTAKSLHLCQGNQNVQVIEVVFSDGKTVEYSTVLQYSVA